MAPVISVGRSTDSRYRDDSSPIPCPRCRGRVHHAVLKVNSDRHFPGVVNLQSKAKYHVQYVRFWLKADIPAHVDLCPLLTQSGHRALYLIGFRQQ